ncbi:sensor histidine kinase [Amedibacillus dolichus]|uniref:sensor histidine kinase n=1 Tax=Amedibacillus dolichus TaxID=31971 RepID=UPI0026738575|nr:HAMP domain-containing sensor histidine kinase [Amedibacillus dolichus]
MLWLWLFISGLILVIISLFIKIHLLRKSAKEIECSFSERLLTDSNTLIDISSNDKRMRHLANEINIQLRKLRDERRKFQLGDLEVKAAMTNISHDLRTPLTAICGYLDLLEQEEKSETVNRYTAVIRNRTEMLKQLTEELFRYSVILASAEALKIEPVVINNVLEESIASFYTILKEKQISPKIIIPQKKIVRNLDRSALSRIFANLLNNAVKYSNGDLEVTLSENGEIRFINHASDLSEIEVGKLFDRFYTVNNARNSTGLGLSISKALVEKMNGTISAEYHDGMLTICIRFGL